MRFVSLGLLLLALPACDNGTAAPTVDYAPLLASLTDDVAVPAHVTAATTADTLDSALIALEASPTPTTYSAAQTAWRNARAAFRQLDALHFGPVSTLGISDRIDFSPADDAAIDGVVGATSTIDATLIANLGGPAKGYLGIEYLLFTASGPSAIATQIGSASGGATCRSCTLARAMADEISSSTHTLLTAWTDPATGYALQIKTAGTTSTQYPRQRGAVDDFAGGISYALEAVVGLRLAAPLGRKGSGTPDPTQDPTRASDSANADMTAMLAGVTNLYNDQGKGFTARVAVMSATLNTETMSQANGCTTAINAIPRPFATAVVNQTSLVQAAFDACKLYKDNWNTNVSSALGVTFIGDNDGD